MSAITSQFGVSLRTARKWLARHRDEGLLGLHDRSSRPHSSPRADGAGHRIGHEGVAAAALDMRADRGGRRGERCHSRSDPTAGWSIAAGGVSVRRRWCSVMNIRVPVSSSISTPRSLAGSPALAIASRGRAGNVNRHHGIGWDVLHIAVDDYSRVAYVELLAMSRLAGGNNLMLVHS